MHQRTLSRTLPAQDQDKRPFRSRLPLQSIEYFADYFGPAVKNRCMLKIKRLQSAIRVRIPVLDNWRTFSRDDLTFQLLRDKGSEMLTKQFFELLEILI